MPTNVLNHLGKRGINSTKVQSIDCHTPPPTHSAATPFKKNKKNGPFWNKLYFL